MRTFKERSASIESVVFSPNGHLLSTSADNTITLWHLDRTSASASDADNLIAYSCTWLKDYLQTPSQQSTRQQLCQGF